MIEDNKETKQKNDNKKKWIIVITIIIAVCVGGVILAYYVKNSKDNCNNTIYSEQNEPMELKPIIYLYPEQETNVNVELGKPENITCSYPKYTNGWNVIAKPDGTLTDTKNNRELYSLYWEGIHSSSINTEDGFVVEGNNVAKFLEEKLAILGLNNREAEEFIIYWLPKLEGNKYNYIRFETMEEINENMPLKVIPTPDTTIRVMMEFKALDEYIEIPEQQLKTPERKGFVVVEWGGTQI